MKYILLSLVIMTISISCSNQVNPVTKKMNETKTASMVKSKQLRHVVMFKFNEVATAADIKSVEEAFKGLPSKIAAISDFEWGINNSPEGLNKDFTHIFFVSFNSETDREIYLPHPAHLAFVEVLKPHLNDVMVMDYWN